MNIIIVLEGCISSPVFAKSVLRSLPDCSSKQELHFNLEQYAMRNIVSVVLFSLLPAALAAPAIVWKSDNNSGKSVIHSSEVVKAADIFEDVLSRPRDGSSLAAVVFLFGRSDDGSESLSALASSGALPGVASKYDAADCFHHHVADVQSPFSVARDAKRANPVHSVLDISIEEFYSKMTSLSDTSKETAEAEVTQDGILPPAVQHSNKRAQALAEADVIVVNVEPSRDATEADAAILRAIDHPSVKNVVVTSVRSFAEVKNERNLEYRHRRMLMQQAGESVLVSGRRRLDQNANNGGSSSSMTGVYYVQMTPNIFSGILFGILFAVISFIGISCMGMIQGQTVYVSKLPSVGREA